MKRILKVFVAASQRKDLLERYKSIESYKAFVLLEVFEADVVPVSRKYVVEDITPLYSVRVTGRMVRLGSKTAKGEPRRRLALAGQAKERLPSGPHHYLVEFIGPIKESWLERVRQLGGQLRAPYQNFVYVVRASDATLSRIEGLRFVRGVAHLPYRSRIATALREKKDLMNSRPALPRTRAQQGTYVVEFFVPEDARRAKKSIAGLGLQILSSEPQSKVLLVQSDGGQSSRRRQLERLSEIHGVRSIREQFIKHKSNDVAARIMNTRLAVSSRGLGLSGKGEVVAVCDSGLDTGDPKTIHPDFRGRVVGIRSYRMIKGYSRKVSNPEADDGPADVSDGHGTHVAGSVLGSGKASRRLKGFRGPVRGLAYRARLFFQAIEQEMKWRKPSDAKKNERFELTGLPTDVTGLFEEAYRKGARIHTNSWSGGDPGAYDSNCEQLDRFVWRHPDFCVLVAAGNESEDEDADGKVTEMTIESPATAKNCITVGACESERSEFRSEKYGGSDWMPDEFPRRPFRSDPMADDANQVVAFSSRGPTLDGQIKPDLVAPGTFILSTRSTRISEDDIGWAEFPPSQMYFHLSGTSMATPLVAGAAALVREYLRRKRRIARPSASLLKAVLVAGAGRIGAAPQKSLVHDIHQGYGRVDLDRILAPRRPTAAAFLDVKPGLRTGDLWTRQIRVRSSKSPLRVVLAYSDYPGRSLVNNLNLMVTDPSERIHLGNAKPGERSFDVKNNIEVVHAIRPRPGTWTIEVTAASVPHGPQPFALVCLGHQTMLRGRS